MDHAFYTVRLYSYILCFFAMLVGTSGFGQMSDPPVQLSGTVVDDNGTPVPGARISIISSKGVATTTDLYGRFSFTRLQNGEQVLLIYSLGFEPITDTLFCGKDSKLTLNYTLQPLQAVLGEVLIKAEQPEILERLRTIRGTILFAAKKNDIIRPDDLIANKGSNNARQLYAKVSGLNIWESDYGGNQLEIGGRGLSPSRTSNFNTRQNGYDISADPLGYPETYYSPPADAIDRIDILRGAASLQYGSQFGGLVNFILKDKIGKEKVSGETKQTIGSFGLINSYNAIGLQNGKHKFYGFINYKKATGWKEFSKSNNATYYGKYTWTPNNTFNLSVAYTANQYLAQQPGGLTDAQFIDDMYQVTRKRNWFLVNWKMPALEINWDLSEKTKINHKTYALIAERSALGYLDAPNRADPIEYSSNPLLTNRNLIQDEFENLGSETRLLHRNQLLGKDLALTTGIRFYQGNNLKQQGIADSGNNDSFRFLDSDFPGISSYNFTNTNVSLFTEALLYASKKTSITTGLRWESIHTQGNGINRETNLSANGQITSDTLIAEQMDKNRQFIIAGFGIAHRLKPNLELFVNFSQNYRSITFNDIVVKNPTFRVDPNIEDERGYNLDLGLKGLIANGIGMDVTAFYLHYANRIGLLFAVDDETFQVYRLRTNVGQSDTYGVEGLLEISPLEWLTNPTEYHFSTFVNASIIKGRYKSADPVINGNKIELVPDLTIRTGVKFGYKNLGFSVQYTYVNDHFSDALNSFNEVPNGVTGLIPTYRVWDVGMRYSYKNWSLESGINNATNSKYFTRRATGYPGPGIIPANSRNYYLTVGFKF